MYLVLLEQVFVSKDERLRLLSVVRETTLQSSLDMRLSSHWEAEGRAKVGIEMQPQPHHTAYIRLDVSAGPWRLLGSKSFLYSLAPAQDTVSEFLA